MSPGSAYLILSALMERFGFLWFVLGFFCRSVKRCSGSSLVLHSVCKMSHNRSIHHYFEVVHVCDLLLLQHNWCVSLYPLLWIQLL